MWPQIILLEDLNMSHFAVIKKFILAAGNISLRHDRQDRARRAG